MDTNIVEFVERLRKRANERCVGNTYLNSYEWRSADLIEQLQRENERMKWDVHSCGPTCTKAGCVNRQLQRELITVNCEAEELSGQLAAKDQRIAEAEKLIEQLVDALEEVMDYLDQGLPKDHIANKALSAAKAFKDKA